MEKFGIDNLKKVLQFGITLGLHTAQQVKDGFQIADVFALLPELLQIPDFVKNKQAILDEVKDLSVDEIEQLIVFVKDSGVFTSEKIKSIIGDSIDVISSVTKLVTHFV